MANDPKKPRGPINDGPTFDTGSLIIPPEAHQDFGRTGPPRKKKKKPPIVPIALGIVALMVLVVAIAAIAGSGDGVEPLEDPSLVAAPADDPKPSIPHGNAVTKEPPKEAPAEPPPPPKETPPVAKAPPIEPEKAVEKPSRDRNRGKNKRPAGKGKAIDEEKVDDALDRLAAQASKSGKELIAAGDFPAARSAFTSECEEKKGASCFELGRMQLDGKGGGKDAIAALASFDRGCDLRSAEACLRAADQHAADPSPGSEERARRSLEAGCDYASAKACKQLAIKLEKSDDAAAKAKAIAFRARACALGDKSSCEDETDTSTGT